MKIRNFFRAPMAIVLSALALAGCDEGTGVNDEDARVRVLLTDAPADYIESAWVDIGAVQLVPADENEGGIITLTEDATDGLVDLLDLQNAATAELASEEIEAGTYSQLRLIVESAEVELIDGYEFEDGSTRQTLFVPSGAQTGIKLNLDAGEEDEDGEGVRIAGGETVLVLDFDVNQSFVIQGNAETPAGIRGVLFTPTLRVTVDDVAGSISGTVAAPDTVDLEDLVVTAKPLDEGTVESYQTTTATALTNDDGDFTIHFLVPGSYDVWLEAPEGFAVSPDTVEVTVDEDAEVTGIDFTLQEDGGAS